MSDLVDILRDKTRLRAKHGLTGWVLHEESLQAKAADEIDALRAERDSFKAAYEVVRQDCHNLTEKVIPHLRAKNERLRAALEACPVPTLKGSTCGWGVEVDPALCRWYDTTRQEALDGPER